MKNITLSIVAAVMAIIAVSCNQSSTKNNEQSTVTSDVPAIQEPSKENDSETSTDNEAIAKAGNFSISPIITDYLTLKNALVSDDDKAAANAGKALLATFNKVDMNTIPADKHKEYMDIADDAKEHAEHIGDNVGNIAHQREHLAVLSEDVKDLIALFGTSKKLYQDHCPMFNDGKGAIWLSESKEIKNPYYGSEMLTCGNVQQELK
ncbi:hypothetical protein CMU73_04015 [Elizabethkingia anophelis]|nr:DUF3347 domain-containing protein [Elizabethkingia anophelis]ASV79775.1 DUF3347 domain-containing protein [Elizabethkingia anophelis]MDV3551364.1 hypothetical protein [Elizabethkingia anophelis]MDV3569808.1 hypothetical protein [Elizabethkingia anophelis]MDV3668929.1 hypothetical protein [Elizabethkingia anophelis]MDV3672717.1 hypothetical protein [Elizabethkingia anophelis]